MQVLQQEGNVGYTEIWEHGFRSVLSESRDMFNSDRRGNCTFLLYRISRVENASPFGLLSFYSSNFYFRFLS